MPVMRIPGHDHQKPQEVRLEEIVDVMGDCRLCPLWETRTNMVFGVGNPNARVMIVGEGPGRNEDLQGEPFVGAAGQSLDALLQLAGLRREDVYIGNTSCCAPRWASPACVGAFTKLATLPSCPRSIRRRHSITASGSRCWRTTSAC